MKRIGKRKMLKYVLLAAILVVAAISVVNIVFGVILFSFYILCAILIAGGLLLNKCVKKTYWNRNLFLYTSQFVSNAGYRDNTIRNYDIVNLGSNPALFAFFYENVKGQNWSTGSQGLDMDFEILKYFHSYVREGGTVLIPIMPFTSISSCLKGNPAYSGRRYYAKFAKILDGLRINEIPELRRGKYYHRFPLLYDPKSMLHLFHDADPDIRYCISGQPMGPVELETDANGWIARWMKEFGLETLDIPLTEEWKKYFDESVERLRSMIDYCLVRNYKPVLICPPMTDYLSSKFPQKFRQAYILDFVNQGNEADVPFLDYTDCEEFKDASLYFNSFFLNLRGRKLFTRRVLKDLGLQ